jgi:hydrogenase small subunit
MTPSDDGLFSALLQRGVSRRTFVKFCVAMAGALAIPAAYAPRIAAALSAAPRIPIVWLRGQGCGGDGDALLRAANPTVAELLLEIASVDYFEAMMAPAGPAADLARVATMETYPARYFAVVEGAVPTADDGIFGVTGGRVFRDVVREVCDGALATIAVGSCAFDGGLSAAAGGRTGAVGVGAIVGTDRLVNLPGCPVNAANLTATIVHYLTFNELPPRDMRGRPLFAYGGLVHNQCERRSHFEYGEFVLAWGDEAAQKGWCLYKMGCKGPETFANCPTVRYAQGASWPVKAGHPCIGCTMPAFWDTMSPFYQRLASPLPMAPDLTVDQVGGAAFGAVAALTAAHGAASYARQRVLRGRDRREARRQPVLGPDVQEPPESAPIGGTDYPEAAAPDAIVPETAPLPPAETTQPEAREPIEATQPEAREPIDATQPDAPEPPEAEPTDVAAWAETPVDASDPVADTSATEPG